MKKIVYFHGYGSSPESSKVRELRLMEYDVIAPSIPVNYDKARRALLDFFRDNPDYEERVFVGTSLGAFWANEFAVYFGQAALLINPCVMPSQSLKKYKNPDLKADEYPPFDLEGKIPRTVMLAKNDDVLSAKFSAEFFRGHASVLMYEKGGHQFNDYEEIADQIDRLDNGWFVSGSDGY